MRLKILEPKIKEIQTKYKEKREEQAVKMMGVYKEAKVNPFSSIFLLIIQLPIVIALYLVFARGGLPEINSEILYSFIPFPENVNMNFLGLIDVAGKRLVLAVIAGVAQFTQSHFLLSAQNKAKVEKAKSNPMLVKNLLCKEFNIRETSSEAWLSFEQINNTEKFETSHKPCRPPW
jgi:YidC/Oxa1 family membrane protein insertase